jgi:hypothetical protein
VPRTDRRRAGPRLGADPAATARRREALKAYMDEHVLGPAGFCCSSYADCRVSTLAYDRFFEGQLSHVGHHYALNLCRRPLSIVLVGQEIAAPPKGVDRSHITLDQRYSRVYDHIGLQRRYYADRTHEARNPHMRGTTSALRIIFGKGLGAGWEQEFLQTTTGEQFHLFDAFCLVNVLLCSNFRADSNNGASTKIMRRNCLRHFEATMAILEPTLLVLQGKGVQNWIAPVLGQMQDRAPHLAEAHLAGNRILVGGFSHPSARGGLSWGNRLDSPYLREVIEPTLRLAVSLL